MTVGGVVRAIIAHCLYVTGLLDRLANFRLRNRTVVLMYHRVLTDRELPASFSSSGIVVNDKTFERHMRYLRKHFHVIGLEDLVRHFEKGQPSENRSCLITFDDGWKDNCSNAFRILSENSIPALIFLTTAFIDSDRRFWQDRLAEGLHTLRRRAAAGDVISMDEHLSRDERIQRIIRCRPENLDRVIADIITELKESSLDEIEKFIAAVSHGQSPGSKENSDGPMFMNWDDVLRMEAAGIQFGSHGHSHCILPRAEMNIARKELEQSKSIMEAKLGKEVSAFSYPNGDFNEEVVGMVRDSGYRIAFGTENGRVSWQDNPYKLKRVNVHEDMTRSIPMFLARIVGLW